jgi:predicted  nucleic acid-binding Zn-ribbon protein
MPTADRSIPHQLRALIRLQHLDSKLDQVEKLRGDLPNDIRDLEDERAGLETRIERYKQEAQESEIQRRTAFLDISESEEAIGRYEKQQLQVRNNREYDALTKEVEAHHQRIADTKTTIEALTLRDETNVASITEAEARLNDLNLLIQDKQNDLSIVISDTEHEREALDSKRDKISEAVDNRYLKAYHRLRNRVRDGRAVVPLERGAAAGFAVPPQQQVEIRQHNRIVVCEHTGRIIVDLDLFEETISEMKAKV